MTKCGGPHENKITEFLAGSTRQGTLLGNEVGELVGNITRGDVVRAFERSGDPSVTVLDVGSTNLILAYEDETLHDAIARMLRHDVGRCRY
jgi:chloride channel protein, CIC family